MQALLSIIIVNYKTPRLVVDCLVSVYRQTSLRDFEVIVVDNDSKDNSRDIITESFPQVMWLQMSYNAGFARANNAGIRKCSGDIVLLLNSDTIIQDDAISQCYALFRSSSYVACGVQLRNPDGTPQISGNYFMYGGLNNLLPLPYVGQFLKAIAGLIQVKKPHVPETSGTTEVHWINGAFLMVKTDAITRAGLMDEDFFLYAEEVEWCYRLGKFGKLAIFGQCQVVHLQGETSNAAFGSVSTGYSNLYDKKGLQIMLSNMLRIRKQLGVGWYTFHMLMYSLTVPVFTIAVLIRLLFLSKDRRQQLSGLAGFSKNVAKLWAYYFTILVDKPFFYKIL